MVCMSKLKPFALVLLVGCGGDDEPCSPAAQTGCEDGLVCENVSGGEPACFAPISVEGRVFDLSSQQGVSAARIVAVDVNGAAVSNVVTSGSDGSYKLPIPTDRNEDGTPVALGTVTLRADAKGYDAFPGTVRQPLPIDMTAAVAQGDGLVVKSTLTDIAMLTAADGGASGRIEGKIEMPDDRTGAVVVAEANGTGYPATVARNGEYAILNVPAGSYTINAYMAGHNYTVATADVAAATVKVDLKLAADEPSAVSGQASIVNGDGATTTSVVLFIESTYDPATGRGVTVPGLRAGDVTTAFTIEGVPTGKYVVVAAFENDGLVRDPDLCISGTDDVHIDVAAATPLTIGQTFKITGALAVMEPGALAAQAVIGTPTFKWVDDSSEDQYLVELFDAYGQRVWMNTIAGVSGGIPQLAYDGPALTSGMYYQFRVTSTKNQCALSRTEDLKGVFYMQ
jgi:hypothetical protein